MAITQASEEGLKISNAGTNGQYLQKQSGNTGGLTWADVSTDLVADTSPQLGGDLASNGHDIKIADASGYDGNNIYMGSDNDVRIHHDGSNFSITEATGDVTIQAADDIFLKPQGGENGIKVIGDGAVELYHDNSKKLETTSSGIDLPDQLQVDGQAFATGGLKINSDSTKLRLGASDDLEIYHNGTDSIIDNNTGELKIQSDNIQFLTSDASEKFIDCNGNGNVEIYHNNVKTAQTEAGGVWNVRGPTDGNATLMLSANDGGDNGDSWRLLAEGETNTKKITLTNNPDGNWETSLTATGNAGVELYHNNVKKLSTTANGICFNSDTAAANALSDYEEGTYTANFNIEGQSNMSMTGHYGEYLKVGRLVTVMGGGTISSVSGASTGTAIEFTNLPFAVHDTSAGNGHPFVVKLFNLDSTGLGNMGGTAPYSWIGRLDTNSTAGRIEGLSAAGTQNPVNAGLCLAASSQIHYMFTYITDA
jgi:hypothetical protein